MLYWLQEAKRRKNLSAYGKGGFPLKDISVFDVIGPNMIGPSSSHTAGALRIALMAGKIAKGKPKKVTFVLYGSFAMTYKGHGTDKALLAGVLGMNTEDYRIRDSFRLAEEAGIEYHFVPCTENKGYHPNRVEVIITNDEGTTTSILGVSVGGGNVKLKQINGADISVSGNLTTLFVQQYDRPGVVAHISKCLTDYNVNIAFMKLYRDKKGENAYTIIETDEALPDKLVQEINDYPDIKSAIVIDL